MEKDILKIAKDTIFEESRTLEDLGQSLDQHFVFIVELLFKCKGRIIITGIGKSALIAQKIVATLNSTGSPAIYMHAGDAAHGDLGMVRKEDILICLSKSGQTAELQLIVPLVKLQGTTVIGICSEPKCFLTESCDHHLIIPLGSEASPNNLIPTSSTTAQLALGDAIAVCLLSLRGFSNKEFASLHPGGSIGKQLFVKVEELYLKNEKPVIHPDASIRETIIEMTSKRLGATVICEDNKILGIITDGDLRRMLQSMKDISHLTAKDIMTVSPYTIESDVLAYEAFTKMRAHSISHIIISDHGDYKGIIHIHDFIREGFL
ncbi:KpsF/GutQ family sugar-phosphate isomerase [Portibacter lacus]|uniref:D-arabinose 5-phosphate isomerase n=1 Tax=Portibacter lacus TaxID=1099794 RepID=A0AA37WGH9_9BACT|nr:KpsF/GutQ family sugar-phosphate isomerase [Portibacter lacus]GLR17955.1 D-arabinose 5-phosphate isomerase [Portibacter lacus]